MSGIYGYFSTESKLNESHRMLAWTNSYGHEGSDSVTLQDDMGVLGICYDSFAVPLSRKSQEYEDVFTIDALIYNKAELVEKFGASAGFSLADSDELIIYKIVKYNGTAALKEVNGDFAGAIYWNDSGHITLFRDHIGVRPLFYYQKDKTLAWGSDLRAITALSWVDTSISEGWLYNTALGKEAVSPVRTAWEYIYMVPGAGVVNFYPDGSTAKENFWKPCSKKIRFKSEEQYKSELRRLIEDAVRIRLNKVDGAVGGELSGGLDSSVVDILINRQGREGVFVSWSADPDIVPIIENDERINIVNVCKQENITCNYINANIESDYVEKIFDSMKACGLKVGDQDKQCEDEDETIRYGRLAWPYYTNTDYISGTAMLLESKGVKVCFTGHGGDEGVSHRMSPYEMFLNREYFHYCMTIWKHTSGKKNRFVLFAKLVRRNIVDSRRILRDDFRKRNVASEWIVPEFNRRMENKHNEYKFSNTFPFAPRKYIESGLETNRLMNVALQGAYFNVRYMAPYLDYRVLDYALSIPRHFYLKGRINRYIFRESFKDIMPESLYCFSLKEDYSFRAIDEAMVAKNAETIENEAKQIRENEAQYAEHMRALLKKDAEDIDFSKWEKCLDVNKINDWIKNYSLSDDDTNSDNENMFIEMLLVDRMVELSRRYTEYDVLNSVI